MLVPVYNPELDHLEEAIASVRTQTTSVWELILAVDGPHGGDLDGLLERTENDQIKVVRREQNGGIAAATQSALDVAVGEFIALLDQDDTISPHALGAVAVEIARWPDADVLYTDEDKLDRAGRRIDPFCKPGFSPERLRSQMYLGHLGVYRRELVEKVGGFRQGFDGSQDHDLALRTTERARRVVHIPRVLYHWRQSDNSTAASPESKAWAYEAGVRAVQSHLDRIGMPATAVQEEGYTGVVLVEPSLDEHPLVSIIVPTAGSQRIVAGEQVDLARRCLTSIVERSTYPNYEIVAVVDRSAEDRLDQSLRDIDPHVRTLRNPRPFNFAEACNLGRDHARGSILLFLNDDTEVVTPSWIERMVLFADLDGVGVVGALLLYANGCIQHAGLVGRGGGVGHRFMGGRAELVREFSMLGVQSNLLAVTGACIAVRADRYDEVGGMAAEFPLAFNDVDLCLKLLAQGYRNVFDPRTVLLHHESSSRDPAVKPEEITAMNRRWRDLLHDDPYDHPYMRVEGFEQFQPSSFYVRMRERSDEPADGRVWPFPARVD